MEVLPLSVGFAVNYLDGVMTVEQAEIQRMWKIVREHLTALPQRVPEPAKFEEWAKVWHQTCETIMTLLDLPGHGSPQELLAQVQHYVTTAAPQPPQGVREKLQDLRNHIEHYAHDTVVLEKIDAILAALSEGKPGGDGANEAVQAITFAVEKINDHFERLEFLNGWLHGDTSEWPEFTAPPRPDGGGADV
jgi:hypothetical protein